MSINYTVGQTITTRKPHACGSSSWTVLRVGVDYKLQCNNCKRVVMLDSQQFHKAVKNDEQR